MKTIANTQKQNKNISKTPTIPTNYNKNKNSHYSPPPKQTPNSKQQKTTKNPILLHKK